MAEIKRKILNALIMLGVSAEASITAIVVGGDRIIVRVAEDYFGLWDVVKENFVD